MLPDRVLNPGPLTYESGALPIALCGPAPGHDPGAKSYGMEADALRYQWFKYECFLLSCWRDVVIKRKFNQKF